ncbi:YppE family protein [Amphibacillus xylanus]|nr:YppE family protein [Amphibacillus xylanus]
MLYKLTDQLQVASLKLRDRFLHHEAPEDPRDSDFFQMVKAETEPYFNLVAKWEELALDAVKSRKVIVHPQQIEATRENFELILLHSYYIDEKPKKFMELVQAIDYVCQQIKY